MSSAAAAPANNNASNAHNDTSSAAAASPPPSSSSPFVVHALSSFSLSLFPTAADSMVHAKGFASRLVLSEDPETHFLAQDYLNLLSTYSVVFWDGDNLSPSSFTAQLPRLPLSTQLVAFKLACHLDEFKASWADEAAKRKKHDKPIVVVTIDTIDETTPCPKQSLGWWEELGVLALKTTGVTKVLCLGGGECVLNEAKRAPPEVQFSAYRVKRLGSTRQGQDDSIWEASALVKLPKHLRTITWLQPSRTFDTVYENQTNEVVGDGGFGVVYKAVHKTTGKEFAAKVMKRGKDNPEDVLCAEIAVMKAIAARDHHHVHLLHAEECFDELSRVVIVMPHLSGGTIIDRMGDADVMQELDVARVAHATCSALATLHGWGVIHRDVKPENLIFESTHPNSPLKLVDYGCALVVSQTSNARSLYLDPHGMIVGTAEFAAPEVLRYQHYSSGCDVFSVGILVHALLCGELPFECEAKTIFGVWDDKLNAPEWEHISDAAKTFVRGCLNANAKKRPSPNDCLRDGWMRWPTPEPGAKSLAAHLTRAVSFRERGNFCGLRGLRRQAVAIISANRIRAGHPRLASILADMDVSAEAAQHVCKMIAKLGISSPNISRDEFVASLGNDRKGFDAGSLFDRLMKASTPNAVNLLNLSLFAAQAANFGAPQRSEASPLVVAAA